MLQKIRSGTYAGQHRLPSEKELAAAFGVSVGTMTRVLETLVRDGILTRRRGSGTYVSDSPAPAVPSGSVVYVTPNATNIGEHTYFGPIFDALCRTCFARGAMLEVAHAPVEHWLELPERFPDSTFFFVSPPMDTQATLTALWDRKPCFVVVGASWDDLVPFPTVDTDNRGSARRAVEYLLHLGHRRIALVNGENDSANCRDRRRGYEDALRAWDVPLDPAWQVSPGDSMRLVTAARNQLADLLLDRQGPTAVFCAGYFLALEVMDVARRFEVAIPERLSLVAVDDPKSAAYLQPPLTTLRQPLDEIGARGAVRLLELKRSGALDLPLAEYLPAELVLRGSCTAPQGAAPHDTLTLL